MRTHEGRRGPPEKIRRLYEWESWKSKTFMQCEAKITQAYDANLKQWDGFTVSMEEYRSMPMKSS